jgi:hypothetical protein
LVGKRKVEKKALAEHECEGKELRAMIAAATEYAVHSRDFHANPTPAFELVTGMVVGAFAPFYILPIEKATQESLLRVIAEVFVERHMTADLPPRLRPKRNPKEIH